MLLYARLFPLFDTVGIVLIFTMLCAVCSNDIFQGDKIQCVLCKEIVHFICANLREKQFRELSRQTIENWSCSNCKTISESKTSKENIITDETLIDAIKSVHIMGSQFDNFGQQLKAMISSINEIKYENKYIKEDNLMMKNEVVMLSRQLNVLDQALGCDSKLPENQNEACTETVSKIATKLQGTNVKAKNAVRIPSKITDKPKKTLVCLSSTDEKRTSMDLEKKEKMMANYIDDKWSNTALYVNDQMTSVFRNLFFKTRDTAKEVGYKFVWFKNNKICKKKKN